MYLRYGQCKNSKQNGAKVVNFLKVSKNLQKNYFSTIFMDSEVKKIGFSRLAKFDEISEKIAKIRESARGGRICCGIDPKLIFWTLGGLCDQNESYTGLVGPFLMILHTWVISLF